MNSQPLSVAIQEESFSVDAENDKLLLQSNNIGAVANFVGVVRVSSEQSTVAKMELEHYPGMTEKSILRVLNEAKLRWQLGAARVVHRIGELHPGERIVYVGVASEHRHAAFEACAYIMDYLKLQAPFWKKEITSNGARWVDARESDSIAAQRWSTPQKELKLDDL